MRGAVFLVVAGERLHRLPRAPSGGNTGPRWQPQRITMIYGPAPSHGLRDTVPAGRVDVMDRPRMQLSGVVLDSPDPQALARFYEELLGWKRTQDEPGWVKLASPDGGAGLSFQQESEHVQPTWPPRPGDQQMQVHLDIHVDDLDVAGAYAVSVGARLADFQPQDDVRVYFDPVGHPFCLFLHLG
jgi:catechol 2,3-dioxygenase-like lactoylglutathione lyase family enzyme